MHLLELGNDDSLDDEKLRIRAVWFCIADGGIPRGVGQHAKFQERCMKLMLSHTLGSLHICLE